jgi:hypothetical protein
MFQTLVVFILPKQIYTKRVRVLLAQIKVLEEFLFGGSVRLWTLGHPRCEVSSRPAAVHPGGQGSGGGGAP